MTPLTPSQKQLTAFSKVGEQTAEKASASLSKLLSHTVHIETAESIIVRPEVLCEQIGRSEEVFTTVALRIEGGLEGIVLLMIPFESAKSIIATATNTPREGDEKVHTELEASALKEFGNILAGTLVQELSTTIQTPITHSIPDIATDMLKALLDEICGSIAQQSEHTAALSMGFEISPYATRGTIAIIINDTSAVNLLTKLS
jgi:chemotaxis protein CheC